MSFTRHMSYGFLDYVATECEQDGHLVDELLRGLVRGRISFRQLGDCSR
jgi:hypothetical protein